MHRVRAGKLKNDNVGYLFIAPQMILFLVFVLYPIVEGLRLSLYNISMSRSVFTGLGNYIKLANNPVFFKALGNTVYQVAGITLLSVLGGFILSAVIVQKSEKYMAFIRATLYLPTIMTMLVISLIWRWMLNQSTGVLNYLIRTMGMDTV
ncbi:sugar ABC transporter permease, partial [Eubacteriales bacterium OttesenSCG-928-N13]|nr:sugar ABC transporter permease [Eubacteriales bacterium OttesenSCG-928-N13]